MASNAVATGDWNSKSCSNRRCVVQIIVLIIMVSSAIIASSQRFSVMRSVGDLCHAANAVITVIFNRVHDYALA